MQNSKQALKNATCWLIANALGVCVYLMLEVSFYLPRPEEYAFNGVDMIYFWVTEELPVLIIMSIVNITWLIRIFQKGLSPGLKKSSLRIFMLVLLSWIVALFSFGIGPHLIKFFLDAL